MSSLVPEEAITLATEALKVSEAPLTDDEMDGEAWFRAHVRAAVEAAAPLILAAYLEQLADEGVSLVRLESGHKWRAVSADHLRSRARDLRETQASVLRGEGDPT